ncbi:MAG: hypothetical protein L0H11_10750, partial [Brevibacterium aurantiacum]|nr:hypothetical protein [Brevibacterium aurantiacum]
RGSAMSLKSAIFSPSWCPYLASTTAKQPSTALSLLDSAAMGRSALWVRTASITETCVSLAEATPSF